MTPTARQPVTETATYARHEFKIGGYLTDEASDNRCVWRVDGTSPYCGVTRAEHDDVLAARRGGTWHWPAARPPVAADPGEHEPHRGNHIDYACGFSGPHCWKCGEPWPCRTERGVTKGPATREPDPAPLDRICPDCRLTATQIGDIHINTQIAVAHSKDEP